MLYDTEHVTKRKENHLSFMNIEDKRELKEELGKKIKSIREKIGISQRELARRIELPNSNLKYIEDGINAPSFDVYKKIIVELQPDEANHKNMDYLYSKIRGTPPPDICEFVMENYELFYAIAKTKTKITKQKGDEIKDLLGTLNKENYVNMEDENNG